MVFESKSHAVNFIKQVLLLDYRPTGDTVNQMWERPSCLECQLRYFGGNIDGCSSPEYILNKLLAHVHNFISYDWKSKEKQEKDQRRRASSVRQTDGTRVSPVIKQERYSVISHGTKCVVKVEIGLSPPPRDQIVEYFRISCLRVPSMYFEHLFNAI